MSSPIAVDIAAANADSLLGAPKKPARRSTAAQHPIVNPRVKRTLDFDHAAPQPQAEPHVHSHPLPPALPAQLPPPTAVPSGSASTLPALDTSTALQQTVQAVKDVVSKAASGASAGSKASKHSLHKRKSCSLDVQQLLASEE